MNRPTDDLDDLTLPQRPRRTESRAESRSAREDLRDDMATQDREFTLSTGTVLALFFGLALVCAVFFGFGYSMGRKSAVVAAVPAGDAAASSDTADASATDAGANKPSAGSPVVQTIPAYQPSQGEAVSRSAAPPAKAVPAGNATSVTVPLDGAAAPKPKKPVADPDAMVVGDTKPVVARVTPPATPPVQTMNAGTVVPGGGTTYVQIAAVSHKEDADVLLSALRRRGYTVFTRPSDSDKLIHVQVGPFANKKDAEVMRQRLLGDGYNAILK